MRLAVFVLLVAFVTTPTTIGAQQTSARAAPTAGPRLNTIVTGYRVTRQQLDSTVNAQRQRQNVGKPVALMIVGGALFVAGLLVEDDVGTALAVGGAIIGAYGLYLHFR